jgi:TadE-like protein
MRRGAGQGLVEAAVAFPLLIMVMLGLVQLTLYVHAHNVVEAAAQEGVRIATSVGGNRNAAVDHANAILRTGPRYLSSVNWKWTPQYVGAQQPPDAQVLTANGTVDTIIPWFDPSRGGLTHLKLPLNVSARMSQEHFRPTALADMGGQ